MKKTISLIMIWSIVLVLWTLDFHYTLIDNDWITNNDGWWVTLLVTFLAISYVGIILIGILVTELYLKYYKKQTNEPTAKAELFCKEKEIQFAINVLKEML